MRAVKPWVTALNIDEGTFADWTAKVPKHESITFWCLDRGHVRLNDYFVWAMDHYGLPFVQPQYFSSPANRDLWMKIQTVANWGPGLLPLEEWDGVIYVACVEPPEDIRWSFPVQYVLASPADLKIQWERLNGEPTRIGMSIPQTLDEEHTSPGVPMPAATAAAPAVDTPSGFRLNLPSSTLEETSSPAPQPAADDSPEGLNLTFIGKKPLRLDNIAPKAPPAEPAPQPEPQSGLFTLVNTPPAPTSVASDKSGAIDADRMAPSSVDAARTEDEAIAWVFQQLKQHFRNSWIFTLNSGALKVWRWDSAARPTSPEAEAPIDLTHPSLFRIVTRTAMPYHGHVVESPTNTGFFRSWGLRATPPHVTAVPLMSDGHVVAVLLCSGDKPAQPDQVLRFSEKMAHAITTNLGRKAAA